MIIVCQTSTGFLTLRILERHLGQRDDITYVSTYQEVLDLVLAQRDSPKRTVVVSSNVFHETLERPQDGAMTGSLLASAVKSVDPDAWFYLYSAMPSVSEHFDGTIPKAGAGRDGIRAFVEADPVNASSVNELNARLPWKVV